MLGVGAIDDSAVKRLLEFFVSKIFVVGAGVVRPMAELMEQGDSNVINELPSLSMFEVLASLKVVDVDFLDANDVRFRPIATGCRFAAAREAVHNLNGRTEIPKESILDLLLGRVAGEPFQRGNDERIVSYLRDV